MNRTLLPAAALLALLLAGAPCAHSQSQQVPDVQIVNLQVVQNQDGSQSVITPKGDLAHLPGAGVKGDAAQIYFGSKGGFWYVDRNGTTVDLSSEVQALQARRARTAPQQQVPQYAPVAQEAYYDEAPQQSTNNGGGALNTAVTATAAGLGAAAGAAMSNHYNTPYGTPYYYGAGARPYYNNNGQRRELDDVNLNQNQKAVMYNKRQLDKQPNVQASGQASAHAQQARESREGRKSASGGANFQKQENWYKDQRQQDPQRFQQTASNPFTNDGGSRGGREGRSEARSSRGDGGARSARGGGSRGGGSRGGGGRRR
jgi:hypothetical protein